MTPKTIIQRVFDGCRPELGKLGAELEATGLDSRQRDEATLAVASALLSMATDCYRLVGGDAMAAQCLYAAADKAATKGEPK